MGKIKNKLSQKKGSFNKNNKKTRKRLHKKKIINITNSKRLYKKIGGENIIFTLYSDVNHLDDSKEYFRISYNVTTISEKLGRGNYATAYRVKLCNEQKAPCVKFYNKTRFREFIKKYGFSWGQKNKNIPPIDSEFSNKINTIFKNTLNQSDETKYVLRIFGGNEWGDYLINKDERDSLREIHNKLSKKCGDHVCKLYDFGVLIDDKGKKMGKSSKNTCKKNNCFYALMEGGSQNALTYFTEKIRQQNNKEEIFKEICEFTKQTISNITCLHENKIMHYDIKEENCVVTNLEPLKFKFIDFGFSFEMKHGKKIFNTIRDDKGTPGYYPENYNGDDDFIHRGYDDIYAIFVMFSSLLDMLFYGINQENWKNPEISEHHELNKLYLKKGEQMIENPPDTYERWERFVSNESLLLDFKTQEEKLNNNVLEYIPYKDGYKNIINELEIYKNMFQEINTFFK
tara:strand:- start:13005 stop:14375 length:1371 start_codon:yes stop_codon:yes gene_type:complete